MGTLLYDSRTTMDFDDRSLAHLQVVIGSKLRRGESFYLTWRGDAGRGTQHVTIWLNPSIALAFEYSGSRMPLINRLWIEELARAANSAAGLALSAEPDPAASLPVPVTRL